MILMHKNLDKSNALLFSLKILFHRPVLFLPKLIVALLYGLGVLWSISLVQKIIPLLSLNSSQVISNANALFGDALLVLALSAVAFFLDILFSGLYPALVEQAVQGGISFSKAFAAVRKKLHLILYSGIVAWVVVGVVSLLLSAVLLFFNLSEISWVISFAVAFSFIFFFYFLFPTVVFKDDSVKSSFRDTIKESLKNSRIVFVYSLIPFGVSVVKFVVAFFSADPGALLFYWALVIITAFVYSVHAVLNQVLFSRLYLRAKKN